MSTKLLGAFFVRFVYIKMKRVAFSKIKFEEEP